MIQTQNQLFSTQFLTQLRSEVSGRTKTSKAVIEAMKSLSALNESNKVSLVICKKKIAQLEEYIVNLKQENCLLVELLESTKEQFVFEHENKEKRLEEAYEREAKLTSENEGLKSDIEKLKLQLEMLREKNKEQEEKEQQEYKERQSGQKQQTEEILQSVKQKQVSLKQEGTIRQQNQSIDLAMYLKSQTSIKQLKSENDFKSEEDSLFLALEKQRKGGREEEFGVKKQREDQCLNVKRQKRGKHNKMSKSSHMANQSETKTIEQQIYMKILYPKNEQSNLLSE